MGEYTVVASANRGVLGGFRVDSEEESESELLHRCKDRGAGRFFSSSIPEVRPKFQTAPPRKLTGGHDDNVKREKKLLYVVYIRRAHSRKKRQTRKNDCRRSTDEARNKNDDGDYLTSGRESKKYSTRRPAGAGNGNWQWRTGDGFSVGARTQRSDGGEGGERRAGVWAEERTGRGRDRPAGVGASSNRRPGRPGLCGRGSRGG